MIVRNVMVGSDPELFIVNTKTGKVVSSIGLIPGKKGEAYRTPEMPEGCGLQIDNILAEFNIPPARTRDEFLISIEYMKTFIREYVKNVNPDLDIMCASSAMVDTDQLQSDEAKEFGCCPDYNAYTEDVNVAPEGTKTNMRSTGCHIHVSYDNPNTAASLLLIKYLDMYLGIPFVVLDPDKKRRELYGKAGCFRLCKYGFEYRTLGGYAISSNELIKFMWKGVMKAIEAFNNADVLIDSNTVQYVINNSDVEMAKELIKKYNLM